MINDASLRTYPCESTPYHVHFYPHHTPPQRDLFLHAPKNAYQERHHHIPNQIYPTPLPQIPRHVCKSTSIAHTHHSPHSLCSRSSPHSTPILTTSHPLITTNLTYNNQISCTWLSMVTPCTHPIVLIIVAPRRWSLGSFSPRSQSIAAFRFIIAPSLTCVLLQWLHLFSNPILRATIPNLLVLNKPNQRFSKLILAACDFDANNPILFLYYHGPSPLYTE